MTEPEQTADYAKPARARFAGKVALITGASDHGIGGAIAERLVDDGATVFLTSPVDSPRLVKRLERRGGKACYFIANLCEVDSAKAVVAACLSEFGRIDYLINNAGIEFARPIETVSEQECEDLLQINLHAAIRLSRAAIPNLTAPGGAIINVASALGLGGCPGFSVYSASKAGLVGFTQSLAWELGPRGIRVLGVAPALVATPMTVKHLEHLTAKTGEQILDHHPLGIGRPHDVAAVIAFLVSDDARWMTGVTLPLGWAPHYPLPVEQFMTQ